MFDVTERVRTGLYLFESGNTRSVTSPPLHFECLLATSAACLSSEMDDTLKELVPPGISTATRCFYCHRVSLLPPGVSTATGCLYCHRVYLLPPGVPTATGCRYCHRVSLLPPGVSTATGCLPNCSQQIYQ
jgi:hypothetical protein